MKTLRTFLLISAVMLTVLCLSAFQTVEETGPTISNAGHETVLNPLTGTPVSDPEMLQVPPVFVPITRYPSLLFRPSSGNSQAQWVFEMYVSGEESRPILMFYGEKPSGNLARLNSAIYGLEELRRQYNGIIIAGGTSKSILDSGILNLELWYGVEGDQLYPVLPLENYEHILDKWKKLATPADVNNMSYAFSETPPEGGAAADSLYFRYAQANQILWRYDPETGKYYRMQNSVEDPYSLVEDVDKSNSQQVAVDNLIVLMAHHDWAPDQPHAYGLFTVNFNYVDKNPALIFRDGKVYNATWTSKSETFERESNRLRPLRILDIDGNNFRLKPGQTWVHVIMPGNPYYEVEAELGSEITPGSGHWKVPYISFKPGAIEEVMKEVKELEHFEIHLNENL
jgi:hypothetical protein